MAFDATKPPTSGFLVSSEIRQNWTAIQNTLGETNLLADPTFLIWAAGDTSAPAHYVLSGTGAAIARAGTGLGDTTRKVGKFCAKVMGGAATAVLTQSLLTTTSYDDYLDGLVVSVGSWVWSASASAARLEINDGFAATNSAFHTGNSTWQWLTASRTIDLAATKLEWRFNQAAGTTGYVSGPTFLIGETPPGYFVPAPVLYGTIYFPFAGTLATGTNKGFYTFARPAIVKDVQLQAVTAPATQAVIIDVNQGDGTTQTSMYATRPQIAAAAKFGAAQPDTTYQRRCFTGVSGASGTNAVLSYDVDQVGTGTAGADLAVQIRCLQYARPLEQFLAAGDIN